MSIWKSNGTKILGYSGAAVGAALTGVMTLDPTLVTAVAGPKYGAYFALAVTLFSAAVAKRGHTNGTNQNPPQ